jgi:hypothetical protein
MTNDGRIRDWPAQGLTPIGAAKVEVSQGEGLDLLAIALKASGQESAQ